MRALGQAGQSPPAGSVRFAASGNFAHHEVNPIDNRHWQLARQAEQQPFLDQFFEFVPAVLQGSCICPYSVKTRYGTVIPTLFEQFVLGAAHRGTKVLGDHDLVLPDLRGPWVPGTGPPLRCRESGRLKACSTNSARLCGGVVVPMFYRTLQ